MSFSLLIAFIFTSLYVLLRTEPAPTVVLALALSIMTATVPPTATFELPPAADREIRMEEFSVKLFTVRSSADVILEFAPTPLVTLLSDEITFSAPPAVSSDCCAPVDIEAATVSTMVLVFAPALCSYPPLATVISVLSPTEAFTVSSLSSHAAVIPTPNFDGAAESDPAMIRIFASSSARRIIPRSTVSSVSYPLMMDIVTLDLSSLPLTISHTRFLYT